MSEYTTVTQEAPDLIVKLSGKVDAVNYEKILEDVTHLLEGDNVTSLTFDVDEVNYVSSAGLRMFSGVGKLCKSKNIDYLLDGLRHDIYKMFQLTGYASILKIRVKDA